jgi:hypothetical protein
MIKESPCIYIIMCSIVWVLGVHDDYIIIVYVPRFADNYLLLLLGAYLLR